MSPSQYQAFSQCFIALVQADKRLGLFEWTLHQILLRHLRPQFEQVRPPQIVYYGLQQLGEPCSVLLSTLARASQRDDRMAFDSGARTADRRAARIPAGRAVPARRTAAGARAIVRKWRRNSAAGWSTPRAACICADCRSPRRRSRAAPRHLRHARLPDAAALARSARSRHDKRVRVLDEFRPAHHSPRSNSAADLAAPAARVLPPARFPRSRNAAGGRRDHSRAAHRAASRSDEWPVSCKRRPNCT